MNDSKIGAEYSKKSLGRRNAEESSSQKSKSIAQIQLEIRKFVEERNWTPHQKPKDLALSVVIELGELLEHFQWKDELEFKKYFSLNSEEVADELADVLIYLFGLARELNLEIDQIIANKMRKNAIKYPIK